MQYLLDNQALLYFFKGSKILPSKTKKEIESVENNCYISVANIWEITIKVNLGKLELMSSLKELFEFIERNKFEILNIEFSHLLGLEKLEYHHRDPFDRIVLAQSIFESLPLISNDTIFKEYPVEVLWNN